MDVLAVEILVEDDHGHVRDTAEVDLQLRRERCPQAEHAAQDHLHQAARQQNQQAEEEHQELVVRALGDHLDAGWVGLSQDAQVGTKPEEDEADENQPDVAQALRQQLTQLVCDQDASPAVRRRRFSSCNQRLRVFFGFLDLLAFILQNFAVLGACHRPFFRPRTLAQFLPVHQEHVQVDHLHHVLGDGEHLPDEEQRLQVVENAHEGAVVFWQHYPHLLLSLVKEKLLRRQKE